MAKRRKRRTKRAKGPVRSKKVEADGITFASGLEKHMYLKLKEAGIYDKYEGETFEVFPAFELENECIERQSNGKGEMKQRSNKIRNIKYTPDFTSHDYIIETKGRANESFPLRWKMFKYWMFVNNDKRAIYKPQKQTECDEVIKMILERRKNSRE